MASWARNAVTLVEAGLGYKAKFGPYCKAATKNPTWLIMVVFGRFNWVRVLARSRRRLPDKPVKQTSGSSVFRGIDIDHAVSNLEDQGCTPCFKLDNGRLLEIRQYIDEKVCHDGGKLPVAFHVDAREKVMAATDRKLRAGFYFHEDLTDPVIDEIAKDTLILSVARKYFNAEPVHVKTSIFWLFPLEPHERLTDRKQGTLTFHFDVDDYQAMRMFLYLNDVDDFAGPHVRVPRSHRQKRFRHRVSPFRSRSDEVIAEVYGRDAIDTVTGPAGTGFLENPLCFHKAERPVSAPRLVMIVHYAVRDYRIHANPQSKSVPLK